MDFVPSSSEINGKNHTNCVEPSFSIINTALTE